jgi:hypothetical protein
MENIPYVLLGLCILIFIMRVWIFLQTKRAAGMIRELLAWTASGRIAWVLCGFAPKELDCLIYATWALGGLWLLRRETHADKHSVYILELRACEVAVLEAKTLSITSSGSSLFCLKAATYCDGSMVVAPVGFYDGAIVSEGPLVIKLWGLVNRGGDAPVNRHIVLP